MIEFTPATASDLPKIVAIYNETIPTHQATADLQPQTVAEKQAWFAAHNNHFPAWMIQVDHKIVGWLTLSAYSDRSAYDQTAEISLYLDVAARGHHVGSAALAFVDREAPKHELPLFSPEFLGITKPVATCSPNSVMTTGAICQPSLSCQKEKRI